MGDYLQVRAERRNGMCVLQITGELDMGMTATFLARADAEVRAVPGPVIVDLTGLTFVDAPGARVLTQLTRKLSASRLAAVTPCTPAVRRIMRIVRVPPPEYWLTDAGAPAGPGTVELVNRVQRAMVEAIEVQHTVNW